MLMIGLRRAVRPSYGYTCVSCLFKHAKSPLHFQCGLRYASGAASSIIGSSAAKPCVIISSTTEESDSHDAPSETQLDPSIKSTIPPNAATSDSLLKFESNSEASEESPTPQLDLEGDPEEYEQEEEVEQKLTRKQRKQKKVKENREKKKEKTKEERKEKKLERRQRKAAAKAAAKSKKDDDSAINIPSDSKDGILLVSLANAFEHFKKQFMEQAKTKIVQGSDGQLHLSPIIKQLTQKINDLNPSKKDTAESTSDAADKKVSKNEKSVESAIVEPSVDKAKDAKEETAEEHTIAEITSIQKRLESENNDKHISELEGSQSLEAALKGLLEYNNIVVPELEIKPIDIGHPEVPRLAYGLDRVLFNPGVYYIQDPRSRVYNFDPYLQTIMPVQDFDFNKLKQYVTSSKDSFLRDLAQQLGKKYIGSSSSMTGVLQHFHYLLSKWRPITTNMLSQSFSDPLRSFTGLQRAPSAIFLRWQDGSYAIDADKEFDTANILAMLGKSMEKLLTLPREQYERYRRTSSDQITDEEKNEPEAFHYCTIGDFLMRSQLDAQDPRLPGTGMFDLKTRAVVSIRMDVQHYKEGIGYEVKQSFGNWESFEREYFDMIRAAFLKYSLQVRMGRMNGIFVAFHNIERIFGFQYISLSELDLTIHGTNDTTLGDQEFKLSLHLLNKILDRVTETFPGQSVRLHFETRSKVKEPSLRIYAEPVTEEEVMNIQSANVKEIEEFERSVLGLASEEDEKVLDDASIKAMEEEEVEVEDISEDVSEEVSEDASEEVSEIVSEDTSEDELPTDDDTAAEPSPETKELKSRKKLLALDLTIQNKINGVILERPAKLTAEDEWAVKYDIRELPQTDATWKLYQSCQNRRRLKLIMALNNEQDAPVSFYVGKLREMAKRGREWRKQRDEADAKMGTFVVGDVSYEQKDASDLLAKSTESE